MEHQVVGIADPSSVGVTELLGGKSTYLVTRNEAFCEKCCSRRKQRSFFCFLFFFSVLWFSFYSLLFGGLPGCASSKESTCQCRKLRVWSLSQEYPQEEKMATHSSILAWRILWTEEPGGLQSMGSQRVRHSWAHMCSILVDVRFISWL